MPERVTPRLWTMPDIAARLGVAHETVRSWLYRGQLPAPSGRVGQSPWWAPDVIEPWMRQWERERAAQAAQEDE